MGWPAYNLLPPVEALRMKTYHIQKKAVDGEWSDVITTQWIHYARGVQDGMQMLNPHQTTRIIWYRGGEPVTVRMCANWTPVENMP